MGDGTWRAQVELGYVDGKRKRKYLRAPRRADANKRLQAYLRSDEYRIALAGGQAEKPVPVPTVRELGATWLRSRKFSVKYSTIEREESILRCHVYPTVGDVPVTEVVEEQISEILERIGEKLAPRTVVHVLVVARALFNYGVKRGHINSNPTALIKRPQVPMRKPTFLEVDEIHRYVKAASGAKFEAALLLALGNGMRLGEVLGLRWEDIDLDAKVVNVTRGRQTDERGRVEVAEEHDHGLFELRVCAERVEQFLGEQPTDHDEKLL
jgi:integrase